MGVNPFLDRQKRGGTGRSGVKSEQKTAQRLGARQTRLSGAKSNDRGDMDLQITSNPERPAIKIEAKSTTANSIGLRLDWLAKIAQEARAAGSIPALSISFVHGSGEPKVDGCWVCIPESVFAEIIGKGGRDG